MPSNREIMERGLSGYRKIITIMEESDDTVEHMRSALEQAAKITRDEIEGNRELEQNFLNSLPTWDDNQIREMHWTQLDAARKALNLLIDTAQTLGYPTGIVKSSGKQINQSVKDSHIQKKNWWEFWK